MSELPHVECEKRSRAQKVADEISESVNNKSLDGWGGVFAGLGSFVSPVSHLYIGHGRFAHIRHRVNSDGCAVIDGKQVTLLTCIGHEKEHRQVKWGQREYLIENDLPSFIRFANSINSNREPRESRMGGPFLREGDWNRHANGSPDFPDPWKKLVLKSPIEATVTEIDPQPPNR